ncbi:alanine--tRNA ligase-related protein [endosymbiont GvMRE of Glomus versiforme]|uniref:alanine--tRNA ligase-related protein n=1 Tax=endosymbiont GvMRE of Glomus versiforme TaxID=2039283 RepID=UPI000EEA9DC7|nr:alanine--tRNA ligase-related protein [endosymbiont GvMRE of Glomus versiforme]RHZ35249.1 Alanine--tRNA ligase [endosymbiont GvMRE of Glomus versiforme]
MNSLPKELFTNLDNSISEFCGYEKNEVETEILEIFTEKEKTTKLQNENGYLFLSKTPFYAEKGGQVSDRGWINKEDNLAQVQDVKLVNNKFHLHKVSVKGILRVGEKVMAKIDIDRRRKIACNHSSTHLLNSALHLVLGSEIQQDGSYLDNKILRLDFNHENNLSKEEIIAVENQVEEWIKKGYPCQINYETYEQALNRKALAFFTEKYENIVRTVQFGDFSLELCGGTHVNNSSEIGDFLITKQEKKGKNNLRLEAIATQETVNNYLQEKITTANKEVEKAKDEYNKYKEKLPNEEFASLLKSFPLKISKDNYRKLNLAENLLINFKQWKKKLEKKLIEEKINLYSSLPLRNHSEFFYLIYEFKNEKGDFLKVLAEKYCQLYNPILIIFFSKSTKKNNYLFLVTISKDLSRTKKINTQTIANQITKLYNGKFGGNDLLAQGFINTEKIEIEEELKKTLFKK